MSQVEPVNRRILRSIITLFLGDIKRLPNAASALSKLRSGVSISCLSCDWWRENRQLEAYASRPTLILSFDKADAIATVLGPSLAYSDPRFGESVPAVEIVSLIGYFNDD